MTVFRRAMHEYLELRRALGFKLRGTDRPLAEFVSHLENVRAPVITTALAIDWAKEDSSAHPALWSFRLSVARRFAKYFSSMDPRTEVPPQGILPHRYPRQAPHIYTSDEILSLMDAALRLPAPKDGLRPLTISTLIGLIAVAGLRFSEAIGLKQNDVDLGEAVLTVHRSKFGKTRMVPLHETTVHALKSYAAQRDRIHPVPATPYFLVLQRGGPVGERRLRKTFIQLTRETGLRGPSDSRGPRFHDLRHTVAVNSLIAWYEAGVDVEKRMPLLSTYLGHTHVADTYWYLSASPRLLALASTRIEKKQLELQ